MTAQEFSAADPMESWLSKTVRNRVLRERYITSWRTWSTHLMDPAGLSHWILRIAEHPALQSWLLEMFSQETLPRFLSIIAYSPYLAQRLLANPEYFRDSFQWSLGAWEQTREEWAEKLERFLALHSTLEPATALAIFRHWGWFRILSFDVTEGSDLTTVTQQLSCLADVVVSKAYERAMAYQRERMDNREPDRLGRASPLPVAVFALGKWGGEELNYSSDIDLLLLFGHDDTLTQSSRQDIQELAIRMLDTLRVFTPAGRSYRVDLRLRPLGREGELVVSLAQAKHYYKSWADLWEKQALMKCRYVCGDERVGAEWNDEVHNILSDTPKISNLISTMIQLREKRVQKLGRDAALDVKEGPGGLRDIEFLVQLLQWMNWRDHPIVRKGNTLKALAGLHNLGLLQTREYRALHEAYGFLRRCEHILQIEENLQKFQIPSDPKGRKLFAHKMGYRGERAEEDFHLAYSRITGTVVRILRVVLSRIEKDTSPAPVLTLTPKSDIEKQRWDELVRAEPAIEDLISREEWSRWIGVILQQPFYSGIRHHLQWTAHLLHDDQEIRRFFNEHPGWIRIIQDMLLLSPILSESFWRFGRLLGEQPVQRLFNMGVDWVQWLGNGSPDAEEWDLTRRVRAMELVMGFLEFSRHISLEETHHLQTLKTDAVCRITWSKRLQDTLENLNLLPLDRFVETSPVWIIAVGRWGSKEMDWGSDADMLVVLDKEAAQRLGWATTDYAASSWIRQWLAELARWTPWGYLVNADLRLRPFGQSGELVQTCGQILEYVHKVAKPWEMLAFLKSRLIHGNDGAFGLWMEAIRDIWRLRGWDLEVVRSDIKKQRMLWSQTYPVNDLKFGPGGWLDWWMMVHLYQIESGWWEENFWNQQRNSLHWAERMKESGWLNDKEYEAFQVLSQVSHLWRLSGFRTRTCGERELQIFDARLAAAGDDRRDRIRIWLEARDVLKHGLEKRLSIH